MAEREPWELRDYLAVVRRQWWLVALAIALVGGLVLVLSARQTPQYAAEARVLVRLSEEERLGADIATNLETQSEIASSEAVAALAAEELGTDEPPDSLLSGLSVDPVIGAQVLTFAYRGERPQEVAARANAFAAGYIEFRRQQLLEERREREATISGRLAALREQLEALDRRIARARRAGDREEAQSLEAQRSALLVRAGLAQEALAQIESLGKIGASGGQVIGEADRPAAAYAPDVKKNLVLGLAFGLLLGLGLAFLRDYLARSAPVGS